MSTLAPVINDAQREIIVEALRIINESGPRFPLASDYDPHGRLKGSFLAIEGKHILIAAMVGGHWDQLVTAISNGSVPNPAQAEDGFDVTSWQHWPTDAKADGIAATATDLEVNILGKLAFTRLIVCTADRHAVPLILISTQRILKRNRESQLERHLMTLT